MSGVAAQEIVFQVVVVQFEVKLHHRLSPRWGSIISHFYPGLAPWAAFLRRFAAVFADCVPLRKLGLGLRHSLGTPVPPLC